MGRHWATIIAILRLSQAMETYLSNLLIRFGVTAAELRMLLQLLSTPGLSQKELARRMGISQVVVSNRLDKLERKRLISRSELGRRLVAVRLTATGELMVQILREALERSEIFRTSATLDPVKLDSLLGTLRSLYQVIEPSFNMGDDDRMAELLGGQRASVMLSVAATGKIIETTDLFLALVDRPREAVVGRTAEESGLFGMPDQGKALLHQLLQHGEVTDVPVLISRAGREAQTLLMSAHLVQINHEECILTLLKELPGDRTAR